MDNRIAGIIAEELNQPEKYVENVIDLIDKGNTIPFIARYRKEQHGAMDDTTLRKLDERLKYLRHLEERKEEIIDALAGQEKLTPELETAIRNAATLAEAEELYRPYKQKRRTRATIAVEKGLEPLALKLYGKFSPGIIPLQEAEKFVDPGKGVNSAEEALEGASDIIAQIISDSIQNRTAVRKAIFRNGILTGAKAKKKTTETDESEEVHTYDLYMDFSQSLSRVKDHQVLALNRGEKEGILKVDIESDPDISIYELEKLVLGQAGKISKEHRDFLEHAIADSYDRLLLPSIKNEIRACLTESANEGAVRNFASNLKPLLMQPPVKGAVTMGLDPGYRMGCKVAVVDATGKVLDTTVVYPTHGQKQKEEAVRKLSDMIRKHGVRHIAIGNGTASRETEQMAVDIIRECPGVSYMIVNEAGASVYSASELAAQEFPQYDVNIRSAISIARRMQDPLAELVKIDPKSIGVGQYQHDLPQKHLEESLDGVVEDCVNAVGVDINTASESLLKHVSGLTGTTAKNIVAYREENGVYTSRSQIKKVPKLGPKAFEQCAGFLRIPESKNILDHTGVHPESYAAAQKLLEIAGLKIQDVRAGKLEGLEQRVRQYGYEKAAQECGTGIPTLKDILTELQMPGRDPRDSLPAPVFRTDIMDISDLKPGMVLTGTVRNVIDFGAFVDIGVHQDGLVHISEITDRYIKHPSEILSVGQDVRVEVLDVDVKRKRIGLSIKKAAQS